MILKASSIVQHVIQNKNGTIKHVNVNVKVIVSAKKIIAEILAHVFVKIVFKKCCRYLVTDYDEIIIFMDSVSTKKAYYSNKCYEYCFNKLS